MKIQHLLLNSGYTFNLEKDNPPPPALAPFRSVLAADGGRFFAPFGRLDIAHSDCGDARHFQLSLDGALVGEFLVCPTAGNTEAWEQFQAQFQARIAMGLASRQGAIPPMPGSAPWMAAFFTDAANHLPDGVSQFLSHLILALGWWHIEADQPQAAFGRN